MKVSTISLLIAALLHCDATAVLSQHHVPPMSNRLRGGGACLSKMPISSLQIKRGDPVCSDTALANSHEIKWITIPHEPPL